MDFYDANLQMKSPQTNIHRKLRNANLWPVGKIGIIPTLSSAQLSPVGPRSAMMCVSDHASHLEDNRAAIERPRIGAITMIVV